MKGGVPAVLHIDSVLHALADVAVLPQPERFPGGLRLTLVLYGAGPARLLAGLERAWVLPRGRPSPADAERLLRALRTFLLRAGDGVPRFSLNTIDEVDVEPTGLRLGGTCSPIVPDFVGSGQAPRV